MAIYRTYSVRRLARGPRAGRHAVRPSPTAGKERIMSARLRRPLTLGRTNLCAKSPSEIETPLASPTNTSIAGVTPLLRSGKRVRAISR